MRTKGKPILVRMSSAPIFLNKLLVGQLSYLNKHFEVVAMSAPGDDLQEVSKREGVQVRAVPLKREISIWSDIWSLINIVRELRKLNPQIVHTSTPKAGLLGMWAAKIAKVPVRIHTETGLRFETASGFQRQVLLFTHRLTYLAANAIVAESEGVKNLILKHNLTHKPVYKIGFGNVNGIDVNYWSSSAVSTSDRRSIIDKYSLKDKCVFIFIGRLVRDKGVEELVKAFDIVARKRDNVSLLLLGDFEDELDPLSYQTREVIENHPLIDHVGFVKDIRPYLTVSKVLVLPSYREGFPNVVLQAMAMDVPCIVTPVNGAVEVIQDGETGFIVPYRNAESLSNSMLRCIEHQGLINNISTKTRQIIISRFCQSILHPQILEFYISRFSKSKY